MVAILKKGTQSCPGNYRPVSLTCVICKLLESFIRDVIVDHMNVYAIYSNCQHGFRKHRSRVTQLLKVIEDFTKIIEEKSDFDIIYLDFRKAFDQVPHQRLLSKLSSVGITGNIHKWIADLLSDRNQRVRVGNSYSRTAKVLSGIPQGSILGRILFTIFINDLPEWVSSNCTIFADDTKLYNVTANCVQLQDDIDDLQKWSEMWNLCKVMHVGSNNQRCDYTMKLNDTETINIVKCEEDKDLGVIFDCKLSFDVHIQSAISKANKIVGIIKRTFTYLSRKSFILLYKSLVRPRLEYANVIWFPYLKRQSSAIEKIQRRVTRLLFDPDTLNYRHRMYYLRLPSLKYRRLRADMIQVYKIINGIDDLDCRDFLVKLIQIEHAIRHNFCVKYCITNKIKYYFSIRVVPKWNQLLDITKSTETLNALKKILDIDPNFCNYKYDYD